MSIAIGKDDKEFSFKGQKAVFNKQIRTTTGLFTWVKTMNFVFKTMEFVLKTGSFVFKTMNFAGRSSTSRTGEWFYKWWFYKWCWWKMTRFYAYYYEKWCIFIEKWRFNAQGELAAGSVEGGLQRGWFHADGPILHAMDRPCAQVKTCNADDIQVLAHIVAL